jgi:hypothetical protein
VVFKDMKRLKKYRLFESKLWSKSIIEDLLLDISDKGVSVYVTDGTWIIDKKDIYWVSVNLGGFDFNGDIQSPFTLDGCVIDLLGYMEDCGLKLLLDASWYSNDSWQHYIGCPNCLGDDIEDNYNLTSFTQCLRCGYHHTPDRFLLDKWPVTKEVLELAINNQRELGEVQLTFCERSTLY